MKGVSGGSGMVKEVGSKSEPAQEKEEDKQEETFGYITYQNYFKISQEFDFHAVFDVLEIFYTSNKWMNN